VQGGVEVTAASKLDPTLIVKTGIACRSSKILPFGSQMRVRTTPRSYKRMLGLPNVWAKCRLYTSIKNSAKFMNTDLKIVDLK
jgi:hypothetical protein